MLEKDPSDWALATWMLLASSAIIAYVTRLLDKIRSKKVKSAIVEVLEFIVCVGISFGVYLTSTLFAFDERLAWILSVYLAHKGTHYIFSRLDVAADTYFPVKGGTKNDVQP
jgi:hypothetical protein